MKTRTPQPAAWIAALLSLLLVVPALAGGDKSHTLTLITDDGEHYVCQFDDDDENIRMVDMETGEAVFEIDLGDIELALKDAFDGLESAFDDLDLALHIDGDDNYVRFAADDDEVVLDFDALLSGVSQACAALGDMDFVDAHHRFRGAEGMGQLESELDALREEMRELKKELRRERSRNRH